MLGSLAPSSIVRERWEEVRTKQRDGVSAGGYIQVSEAFVQL
jgi:hypothetical protein